MKRLFQNSVRSSVNHARAKAARPTTATRRPGAVSCSIKKSARLLLSLLILLPLLSSCSEKATYIRGEQGSSGQISINPLTGAASVIITGPYEYCALPKKWNGPNICADTPTEPKKDLQ
jgi:hypothetical protein